jgi:hypothetical protein
VTIDQNRRKLQMQEALIQFYQDVGDRSVRDVELLPNGPDYAGFWMPTTWSALDDQQHLDRVNNLETVVYRLTTFGWYTGLKLAGGLDSADVRGRATELMKAMKLRIDGRRDFDPKVVLMRELAESAKVPLGWASNALHSGALFRTLFGSKYNATPVYHDVDRIMIPPTFGQSYVQYQELANDRSDLIKIDFE